MAFKPSVFRIPTLRETAVVAAVIATVGFLSIHSYAPGPGFLWNVLHQHINLTDDCPIIETPPPDIDPSAKFNFDPSTAKPAEAPTLCGLSFRYRWLLIFLILVVALRWYWDRRKTP